MTSSPSYLQTTATECGLACLGFVAAHFGHALAMGELRARFSVSLRGSTLADLVKLAGSLKLQARPLQLELHELPQLALPCILHWDMQHFVVLLRVQGDRIVIHDPAHGQRRMGLVEAGRHFTGVALELFPAPDFRKMAPRPPVHWSMLLDKVRGLRRSMLQLFVLAGSLQLVALVTPLFTQWIVDGVIVSGDRGLLGVIAIGCLLMLLIRILLEAVRGWLGLVLATQFSMQWAARVMAHLLRLPLSWFETRHSGDVVSRFQSVQSIQQTVTGKLVDIFLDGLFGSAMLVVVFIYSSQLALVVVAGALAYAALRILPHGALHRANDEALVHEARAQTHFLESLRAMQTLKLAGMEQERSARWLNMAVEGMNRRLATQKLQLFFSSGYSLVYGLESLVVLVWGAALVMGGLLSVGMLMAFISYKDEFSTRMQRLVDNLMAVRLLRLHVERLSDIVLAEKEETGGVLPEQLDSSTGKIPAIRIENAGFRYGSESPWVFRHITLDIAAGEHVAIAGPTGCGKTTLAKIILGLLPPTEGAIFVDGIPLAHIGLANWRRQVAAVMQDDQLLSARLQDCICGFADDIDAERMHAAAHRAAIADEISAMPMGYHSRIGDMGSSLSGGQKQRILLARALYRQPRVLLLDEATSHLDVIREQQVNRAISTLAITRITIAHRPDTLKMADRVIELRPGDAGSPPVTGKKSVASEEPG